MTTAQGTTGARQQGRERSRDYRARRHFLGRSAWLAYHAPAQKKPSRVVGPQAKDPLPGTTPAGNLSQAISARALLLGERLDTRAIEGAEPVATAPLAVSMPGGGVAVLFRYGVIVLFASAPEETSALLASITSFVAEPLAVPEQEVAQLVIQADADQHIDAAGNIVLPEPTIGRLQVVADVLAKSLVLAHYEIQIAKAFDLIEPLAATLRNKGRTGARGGELLRHIGNVLAIQHKMVGRVETGEKPELLWEYPGLERLYVRLADEYELRDRDRALDRKLDVISRTVETLLELVQTRSSLRVEWYIVLLIVAELILAGYTSLFHR
jgi:required for meiotic nuclear division protein 1